MIILTHIPRHSFTHYDKYKLRITVAVTVLLKIEGRFLPPNKDLKSSLKGN